MLSAGGDGQQGGTLGVLMSLLVAEKMGVKVGDHSKPVASIVVEEGKSDAGTA
jgi:hypothetical protein